MFVVFGSVCQRSIFTSQFHASADLTWQQRASYFCLWYLCEAQVDEWKLVGTASSHHVFLTAGPPRSRSVQQTGNIGEEAQQLRRMKPGWAPAVLWVSTSASRQRGLILSLPGRQNGGPGAPRGPRGEQPWHGYPRGGTPELLGAAANRRCS